MQHFDAAQAAYWRNRRPEYIGAPLADVVAGVNRYRSDRIGAMKLTMSIPIEEPQRLPAALREMEGVRVSRDERGIMVSAR